MVRSRLALPSCAHLGGIHTGDTPKIFIYEDDQTRLDAINACLVNKRCEITYAATFKEAHDRYDGPYDLMILDHDLGSPAMLSPEDCYYENLGKEGQNDWRCVVHKAKVDIGHNQAKPCPAYLNSGTNFCRWMKGYESGRLRDPDIIIITYNDRGARKMLRTLEGAAFNVVYCPFGQRVIRYLNGLVPKKVPLTTIHY